MIHLNEVKRAEYLIVHGFTKRIDTVEASIVGKYYKAQGWSEDQIRSKILEYCYKFDPHFNYVKHRGQLKMIMQNVRKYDLRGNRVIRVSKSELEKIRKLNNYKLEKVAFTMLVVAKFQLYYKIEKKKEEYENKLYINMKFSDILKISKVSVNAMEKINIKYHLYETGHIDTTMMFNDSYGLKYADTETLEINQDYIEVLDIDEIVSFYPFFCSECGKITEKKKGNRHKMCDDCWKEREKELWKTSKRRNRKNVQV